MTIRLSQQYVDVAGTYTDGELRVHRQYISVLTQGVAGTTDIPESANNVISFVDSASAILVHNLSSDLGLTDSVVWNIPNNLAQTLGITDSFTVQYIMNKACSDTLNFTQTAQKALPASASDTLNLTDEVLHFLIIEDRKIVGNTLNFSQVLLSLSSLPASNALAFTQTVTAINSTIRVDAWHTMYLSQHVTTPYHMWVDDTLALYDHGNVPITYAITQTLNITDSFDVSHFDDVLVFVQSATWGKSKVVSQTINFTETLNVTGIFIQEIDDDLGIGHAFTWYSIDPCVLKSYSPFEGENTVPGAVAPPGGLENPQANPATDRFLLYYPAQGDRSLSVTLRAPELDNRDKNAFARVTRETRGGTIKVMADPMWPKTRTLSVVIIGLTTIEISDVHTFVQATLGKEVGITDWEGREWKGVITNPSEPATHDSKRGWTLMLEFEGEPIVGHSPGSDGSALGITDSVSYTIV